MITITEDLLESLLFEEEGTALDFKASQYPFAREDDYTKSELLKDILAFANSWRRTDAFILIGVEEVRGGRSIPRGVSSHLSDSHLQQFVCNKTNRPLEFSYQVHQLDGEEVGVIAIPLQARPFYAQKEYGQVQADTVYVRRGSSTAIAWPDEIAAMGAAQVEETKQPELSICFVNPESREPLGTDGSVDVVNLELPDEREIPDYAAGGMSSNSQFYRELARYLDQRLGLREIPLLVENDASSPAMDVTLQARIEDPRNLVRVLDESELKEAPSTSFLVSLTAGIPARGQERFRTARVEDSWALERPIGKVQPRAQIIVRGLFIGASEDTSITIAVQLFADNLPDPVAQDLQVDVGTSSKAVTVDDLMDYDRGGS